MPQSTRRWTGLAVLALAIGLLPACNLHLSMQAEAKDQITRTFTLAQGGTVEILNTNGKVQVDAGDGATVEVVAERVVRAANDQAAKDDLAKLEIKEDVRPDHITLDSRTTQAGLNLFGSNKSVNYRVKVPRWAHVKIDTTNSDITVDGLTGNLKAGSTNGRVVARSVTGSVTMTTTNGDIEVQSAKLADDGISCETTNGGILIVLPRVMKARVSARLTNGDISIEGFDDVQKTEQSRRRLDATIGGGGPAIKLETTNGDVRVRGR